MSAEDLKRRRVGAYRRELVNIRDSRLVPGVIRRYSDLAGFYGHMALGEMAAGNEKGAKGWAIMASQSAVKFMVLKMQFELKLTLREATDRFFGEEETGLCQWRMS